MSLFFGTDEKIAKLKCRLKYEIFCDTLKMSQIYAFLNA